MATLRRYPWFSLLDDAVALQHTFGADHRGAALDPGMLRRVVVMGPYLPIIAVSLGGILGANARYLVSVYVAERLGTAFPYGTLLINVSGSLVIGFFLTLVTERYTVDPVWRLFFATGFLGAYTTFSSYTFEAAQLMRDGAFGVAFVYLFGSVLAGMIGVFAGIAAAERL